MFGRAAPQRCHHVTVAAPPPDGILPGAPVEHVDGDLGRQHWIDDALTIELQALGRRSIRARDALERSGLKGAVQLSPSQLAGRGGCRAAKLCDTGVAKLCWIAQHGAESVRRHSLMAQPVCLAHHASSQDVMVGLPAKAWRPSRRWTTPLAAARAPSPDHAGSGALTRRERVLLKGRSAAAGSFSGPRWRTGSRRSRARWPRGSSPAAARR